MLREVYAHATYGRVLLLDQCPTCGGVWFDRWELYFLDPSEAGRLESLDIQALNAPNLVKKGTGMCPLCEVGLIDFHDPALPPDACIRRCPECSGLWLNRGELGKFAKKRSALRTSRVTPAAPYPPIKALRKLQKALDTKAVSRPWTPPEDAEVAPLTWRDVAEGLAFLMPHILFDKIFYGFI